VQFSFELLPQMVLNAEYVRARTAESVVRGRLHVRFGWTILSTIWYDEAWTSEAKDEARR
jgi:hypothetical protein